MCFITLFFFLLSPPFPLLFSSPPSNSSPFFNSDKKYPPLPPGGELARISLGYSQVQIKLGWLFFSKLFEPCSRKLENKHRTDFVRVCPRCSKETPSNSLIFLKGFLKDIRTLFEYCCWYNFTGKFLSKSRKKFATPCLYIACKNSKNVLCTVCSKANIALSIFHDRYLTWTTYSDRPMILEHTVLRVLRIVDRKGLVWQFVSLGPDSNCTVPGGGANCCTVRRYLYTIEK